MKERIALIQGANIYGLLGSLLLSQYGIQHDLIDKNIDTTIYSKDTSIVVFDSHNCSFFGELGVLTDIRKHAKKIDQIAIAFDTIGSDAIYNRHEAYNQIFTIEYTHLRSILYSKLSIPIQHNAHIIDVRNKIDHNIVTINTAGTNALYRCNFLYDTTLDINRSTNDTIATTKISSYSIRCTPGENLALPGAKEDILYIGTHKNCISSYIYSDVGDNSIRFDMTFLHDRQQGHIQWINILLEKNGCIPIDETYVGDQNHTSYIAYQSHSELAKYEAMGHQGHASISGTQGVHLLGGISPSLINQTRNFCANIILHYTHTTTASFFFASGPYINKYHTKIINTIQELYTDMIPTNSISRFFFQTRIKNKKRQDLFYRHIRQALTQTYTPIEEDSIYDNCYPNIQQMFVPTDNIYVWDGLLFNDKTVQAGAQAPIAYFVQKTNAPKINWRYFDTSEKFLLLIFLDNKDIISEKMEKIFHDIDTFTGTYTDVYLITKDYDIEAFDNKSYILGDPNNEGHKIFKTSKSSLYFIHPNGQIVRRSLGLQIDQFKKYFNKIVHKSA